MKSEKLHCGRTAQNDFSEWLSVLWCISAASSPLQELGGLLGLDSCKIHPSYCIWSGFTPKCFKQIHVSSLPTCQKINAGTFQITLRFLVLQPSCLYRDQNPSWPKCPETRVLNTHTAHKFWVDGKLLFIKLNFQHVTQTQKTDRWALIVLAGVFLNFKQNQPSRFPLPPGFMLSYTNCVKHTHH